MLKLIWELQTPQVYAPDFSQEAIARALEEQAFDETVPMPVRMQTPLISAREERSVG